MTILSVSKPMAGVVALALGAILSALLLPVIMRLAVRLDIVDKPGGRRQHASPIPRMGGVAVIIASAVAGGVSFLFGLEAIGPGSSPHFISIVIGAAIVFVLGIADDARGVAPWVKLLAQCTAAIVVVNSGLSVTLLSAAKGLPAYDIGMLAPVLTIFWIVGVTNAFNLIDGLDGLAVSCALVAFGTLLLSQLSLHQPGSLLFVLALIGALLAFFRINRHPARVFLGDSGSMTIGFLIAVRSISSATDVSGRTFVIVPLVALAYPLLDTFVAIGRRWLRGHPFSRADGRHIHHQLLAVGFTMRQAVWLISAASVTVAALGLSIAFAPPQFTLALALGATVVFCGAFVYGIWWLGYGEFAALGKSVYSGVVKARRIVRERIRAVDVAKRIKTAGNEIEVREYLREFVDMKNVHDVELLEAARASQTTLGVQLAADTVSRLILVECPVSRARNGERMLLRVLVSKTGVEHHSAERVVSIIGLELEYWYTKFDAIPAPVTVERRSAGPSAPVATERRRAAPAPSRRVGHAQHGATSPETRV